MPKWWTDTVWTKCQWLFYCNLWIAKELCLCTGGVWTSVKRVWVENRLRVMNQPAFYPPLLTSPPPPPPWMKDAQKWKEKEWLKRRMEIVPSTFLDTQSSLKLTTVYAVSEDSHRGGPVLLKRLMNRGTHTYTVHIKKDRQTGEKERDDGYVYMQEKSHYDSSYSSNSVPGEDIGPTQIIRLCMNIFG